MLHMTIDYRTLQTAHQRNGYYTPLHYVLFERLALYTNMSMWHYCGTLLKSTLLNKDWNACSDILAKWSPGYMPRLLLKNHVPQRPSHVCPIGFKNVTRKNLPHPQSYTVILQVPNQRQRISVCSNSTVLQASDIQRKKPYFSIFCSGHRARIWKNACINK